MKKIAVVIIIIALLSGTAYSASSELGNAVSVLKVIAGFDVAAVSEADADKNSRIELNDAICWLQGAAGFRVLYPDIVLLVATDTDKATLAWLPFRDASTSSDEMKYEVHLSKQEDFEPSDATLRDTVTGESQSDIAGLESGTIYYAMIVAVDKNEKIVNSSNYRSMTTFSEAVIMDETTPVSNAETLKLGTPQEDGTTFTYTQTEESQVPAQGSVVVGYDAQGDMYLRKADSVSSTGTDIIVQTGDASLSDVITQGSIYSKTKLFDVAQAAEQRSARRSGITGTRSVRKDGTRYSQMKWKGNLLIAEQTDYAYSDDSLTLSPTQRSGDYLIRMGKRDVSEEVTLNASVDFQPELITNASWSWLTVESAEIIARGRLALDVQADYNFTGSKEYSFEKNLFEKGWRSVYMIGVVPVYQRIALKVKAGVTVKASSEIQANTRAAASTTIDVGVRYNNGTWEPVFSQEFSKSLTASMNAQGTVEAEIRLIPEIEVKFYTAVAGSLFVEPYFTGTVGAEAIANADLLEGKYSFLTELTQFDADMNVECFAEMKLTVLMKNISILEKTKVGGPLDPPYQLFSLPEIALSGGGTAEAGKPLELTAVIKDGTNNKFDFGTLKWDVFPDKGEVDVKNTETVNPGEYRVTAEFIACEQGDYAVFVSGYGKLGEIARRFHQVSVNVPTAVVCDYTGEYDYHYCYYKSFTETCYTDETQRKLTSIRIYNNDTTIRSEEIFDLSSDQSVYRTWGSGYPPNSYQERFRHSYDYDGYETIFKIEYASSYSEGTVTYVPTNLVNYTYDEEHQLTGAHLTYCQTNGIEVEYGEYKYHIEDDWLESVYQKIYFCETEDGEIEESIYCHCNCPPCLIQKEDMTPPPNADQRLWDNWGIENLPSR